MMNDRNAAIWRLANGQPKRVECGFGLPNRHIGNVTQFNASLHQASRRVTRLNRPASHLRGEHRAAVKMRPNAVGQIGVTPWALLRTDAEWIDRGNFTQSKPNYTLSALSDRVI
jgi:hypothetical protein